VTARPRCPSTTPETDDQRPSHDGGGEQETGDPAVAALALARVLDHASLDVGIWCGRGAGRILNDRHNCATLVVTLLDVKIDRDDPAHLHEQVAA